MYQSVSYESEPLSGSGNINNEQAQVLALMELNSHSGKMYNLKKTLQKALI